MVEALTKKVFGIRATPTVVMCGCFLEDGKTFRSKNGRAWVYAISLERNGNCAGAGGPVEVNACFIRFSFVGAYPVCCICAI